MFEEDLVNEELMLTTIDNPFNPFTQWDEWLAFDEGKGYYTSEYLARIAKVADNLSPLEYQYEVNNAINEIVLENVLGIYRKISRSSSIPS